MARNRYDVDEVLETPFDFAHLKRSFVYIKKYKGKMITALMLSVFAAISGLLGPLITQYALDNTIPQKNMGQLVLLTLAFVGTIAVSITFSTIRSRIMTVVGQDIIFDILPTFSSICRSFHLSITITALTARSSSEL